MRVSGSSSATVAAPPAACYAVVADLASYADWYPGVSEVEVLPGEDGPAARLRFDAGVAVLPPFSCVMTLDERPPTRLTPRATSGPITIRGDGWTFTPVTGASTSVTLALEVEMSVPGGRLTERMIGGRGRRYLIEEPVAALERRVLVLSVGGGG